MKIEDLRKKIFISSQYCTYYLEEDKTVISGIMHNCGYKYGEKLSDDVIFSVERTMRKYNTILTTIVGLGILLYLYCFLFPYYMEIAKLPSFTMIFVLSVIPLVALYLLYIVANKFFENYLSSSIGEYTKVPFKPTFYNIEPKAYERYVKKPRKSSYVLALLVLIFLFYILVPPFVGLLNMNKQYGLAIKLSNIYSKIIPINPIIYAQEGLAKYKISNFKDAEKYFVLANKYSFSNAYNYEILASRLGYLPKENAIKELDSAISKAENDNIRWFLTNEKAIYLHINKDYKKALDIYDELINVYRTKSASGFAVESVYYNRGDIKAKIGDIKGSENDKKVAKEMCRYCDFKLKLNLIR